MTIDYESFMRFQVPDVRRTITKRDTVLYALSIGLAQDPMDERQLDFVDHHRALKVMPSMVTAAGHPGRWLADPRTGADHVKVVHGEEAITIKAPLPAEGELLGRTKITNIIDKGPGRGALVYSERSLIDTKTDTLLAVVDTTAFLRGDGGFGGPSGPLRPVAPAPDGTPDFVVDSTTRPEQALYYRLSGDENPLHADPKIAKLAGYERPILHGLCTMGIVCHALVATLAGYDPTRMQTMKLRFSSPVIPGETVRSEIWKNGAFRARVVERDKVVIDNGLASFKS